jgi:hypothetical protein
MKVASRHRWPLDVRLQSGLAVVGLTGCVHNGRLPWTLDRSGAGGRTCELVESGSD